MYSHSCTGILQYVALFRLALHAVQVPQEWLIGLFVPLYSPFALFSQVSPFRQAMLIACQARAFINHYSIVLLTQKQSVFLINPLETYEVLI